MSQSRSADSPSSRDPRSQDARSTVLAHLSDPHLPSPPLRWREALNKRALSLLSWKLRRRHVHLETVRDAVIADIAHCGADAILVSGDLTNFGTPEEFARAADWLGGLPAPALVVPGNHDCMVRQRRESGLAQWLPWSAKRYPYARRIGDVAVVGVDSGVPSPPFMAWGRVGRRQTKRLRTLLARLGEAGLCRVVMIHHPPKRGLVPWRKSLLDRRAVAAAIAEGGAEIVLHGHSHEATLTRVPGTDIPLLGVASASLEDKRPLRAAGWNHLAVRRDGESWRIDLSRHDACGGVTERVTWKRAEDKRAENKRAENKRDGGQPARP